MTVTPAGRPVAATSVPVAVPTPSTWADVLAGLDRRRVAAFASGDAGPLTEVYAAGDLLAADRATLAAQVPAGCSLHGATTRYLDVRTESGVAPADHPASVALRVRAELAASVLSCPGRPDVAVDGVGPTALVVTLAAADDGYRITAQTAG